MNWSMQPLRSGVRRVAQAAVGHGCPPGLFGYRYVARESLDDYFRGELSDAEDIREIHPASQARHPLPRNVTKREMLPSQRGWWGYSFHDVPRRENGPTAIATLDDCRVVPAVDARGQFWVTILNRRRRALELREMSFRHWQAPFMRRGQRIKLARATWVLERVFDNYSHWLTAHLPKLLLLRDLGRADGVVLPAVLPRPLRESLELFGFDLRSFTAVDPRLTLDVGELTLVSSDRFRPELLRLVASHCPVVASEVPWRRVFISRAAARRRRLSNEDEIFSRLKMAGFERVETEHMDFRAQVELMRQTAVLVAPHGAGLTNMMFCPPGTHVVELADRSFPNPNFYAIACAMGHHYWLVNAQAAGDGHPLEQDLWVDPQALEIVLERVV